MGPADLDRWAFKTVDPIDPFAGAAVMILLGYVYSIPSFIVLFLSFLVFFRKVRPLKYPVVAWLVSPLCSALVVFMIAFILQAAFGIVKDFP